MNVFEDAPVVYTHGLYNDIDSGNLELYCYFSPEDADELYAAHALIAAAEDSLVGSGKMRFFGEG